MNFSRCRNFTFVHMNIISFLHKPAKFSQNLSFFKSSNHFYFYLLFQSQRCWFSEILKSGFPLIRTLVFRFSDIWVRVILRARFFRLLWDLGGGKLLDADLAGRSYFCLTHTTQPTRPTPLPVSSLDSS